LVKKVVKIPTIQQRGDVISRLLRGGGNLELGMKRTIGLSYRKGEPFTVKKGHRYASYDLDKKKRGLKRGGRARKKSILILAEGNGRLMSYS